MYGTLPVEHHVFLRKVRFLLRFKNSDNLICSLFLDNASSEIKTCCIWNMIGLFISILLCLYNCLLFLYCCHLANKVVYKDASDQRCLNVELVDLYFTVDTVV